MIDGESLLGYVIGNLYDQIRDLVYDNNIHLGAEIKSKYSEIAGKCVEILEKIRTKAFSIKESVDKFKDTGDYMESFSSSVKLRKEIYDLVKTYLETQKKNFLAISIDDLDTNIQNGFAIVREIHHYLMLPNIIVILSAKMEQLSNLVEQQYFSDYKLILEKDIWLDNSPAEMAIKYLQKVFPVTHRIQMRPLPLYNLSDITVDINENEKSNEEPSETPDKKPNLTEEFLKLIYRKTGIILIKDDNGAHPLIPLNLRALSQTMHLLNGLEDKNKRDECKKCLEDNGSHDKCSHEDGCINCSHKDNCKKNKFPNENEICPTRLRKNLKNVEHWLIDSISSNAVPRRLADVFCRAAEHPPAGFCAFLVHQLKKYNNRLINKNELAIFDEKNTAIRYILEADSPEKTVCIGDILYLFDKIMERDSNEGYRHFIAAVKMLFSLRVTEFLETQSSGDPDYKSIANLLGNLIVHPKTILTRAENDRKSIEWNTRCNLSTTYYKKEEIKDKKIHLNNTSIEDKDDKNDDKDNKNEDKDDKNENKDNKKGGVCSYDSLIWLSFFVVTPNRITDNDYHRLFGSKIWNEKIPYRLDRDVTLNFSSHWMRFATSILNLEENYKRIFWCVDPDLEKLIDPETKELKDDYKKYRETLPLPIGSIDVIHALTTKMSQERQRRTNFSSIIDAKNNNDTKKLKKEIDIFNDNFKKEIGIYKEFIENLGIDKKSIKNLEIDKESIKNSGIDKEFIEKFKINIEIIEKLGIYKIFIEKLGIDDKFIENLGIDDEFLEKLGINKIFIEKFGINKEFIRKFVIYYILEKELEKYNFFDEKPFIANEVDCKTITHEYVRFKLNLFISYKNVLEKTNMVTGKCQECKKDNCTECKNKIIWQLINNLITHDIFKKDLENINELNKCNIFDY